MPRLPPPETPEENRGERHVTNDQLRASLEFAESLAKREIENIERLHGRTIKYLGVATAGTVLIAGAFGWIGFRNLQNSAITAVHDEVEKQIQAKLTKEDISGIMREQVKSFTGDALRKAIREQITSEPVKSSILQVAREQASKEVANGLTPRHLTPSQSKTLIEKINSAKELDGCPFAVSNLNFDVEAGDFANELIRALQQTKMHFIGSSSPGGDARGLIIYHDPRLSDRSAQVLRDAFGAIGIKAKILPLPITGGEDRTLFVRVGPRSYP